MIPTLDEAWLLSRGQYAYGSARSGASVLLDALLGADSILDTAEENERIDRLLMNSPAKLTGIEIAWLVFKTEIEFASDNLGVGVEWETIEGIRESDALRRLRGLRRKVARLVGDDPSVGAALGAAAVRTQVCRFHVVFPPPEVKDVSADDGPRVLELDSAEQQVLRGGLGDFWAQRDLSVAASRVLFGDADAAETGSRNARVRGLIAARTALEPVDWLRAQVCAELAFGSSLAGIADQWGDVVLADFLTLPVLRRLQRRIISQRPALRPNA